MTTTNINSYILGASTVQNTNLHQNVFGTSAGTAVEGDKQLILTVSGDLSGGGTILLGAGGTINVDYTGPVIPTIPTNVSAFTNDSGYLTSFTETDPTVPTHVKSISGADITNWDTAYGWGDHSTAGYLTSFTEADPTVPSHVKSISGVNITNWDTAYGWGDHSLEGYLTSFTETDPIFQAHPVYNITNTQITEWDTAYGWGDHSLEGYITSFTEADPTVPGYVKAITSTEISHWNTAYGWGDHSTYGYITSFTDTNDYANSLSFSTSTGVLTLGRTGTLNDLTVDLDGRYQLTGTFAETDTLDSVTSRGNTTSNNITVNDLLVSGDLTVSGTTTTVLSNNTRINENILYLNEGGESTITNAVGNGTTVTFTADNTYSVGYTVDITGVTPSSFNLVDAYVTAADSTSFTVTSTVTDTYVSGGEAYGHAHVNVDLGWGGAYDDGTYAHAGFFRDATDGRFKVFDSYTVEPSASVDIDTSHASFNLADIQANAFIGNASTASSLENARTITLSGDVTGSASFDGSSNITINTSGTYLSSASFNTSNGVLTLTKNDTNTVTVDLDGRFTDNANADAMNQGVATTDSPNFVDVTATNFHGTATTAKYADLAEKYTTEIEHPIGTVMMISSSDDYETCPVQTLGYPIGVISENPAFLMNEECDGQALALKGRVPVRVIGPVKKGEAVFVYENGTAGKQYNGAHIVGVALETNTDAGEKLVECVLKT